MNKTDAVITKPNKLISVQQWQDVLNNIKPGAHVLIGSTTDLQHRQTVNIEDAGFEIRDLISYMYVVDNNIELQLWTLARKPLTESTIAKNVIKYGTGGINIDECRIDFISEEDKGDPLRFQTNNGSGSHGIFNASKDVTSVVGEKGRWPANVILDGSEEVVSLFPYSKAGKYKGEGTKSGGIWSESTGQPAGREYGDEGSASRFFKELPTEQDLIKYLVKLITPPNGLITDPFNTINIEEIDINE